MSESGHIAPPPRRKRAGLTSAIRSGARRAVLLDKLNNPLGLVVFGLAGLMLAGIVAQFGFTPGMVIMAVFVGLPIAVASLVDLRFGVLFLVVISFFLMGVKKIVPTIPFGIFLDAGILLLFCGMVFRQAERRDWSFANNPISWWVLAWMIYNVVQIANPVAESREAWFYTVRAMAGTIVFYYVILYSLRNLGYLKALVFTILGLAMFMALYGVKQEFFGLTTFESAWLHSEIERYRLIYQAGRIRLFSFLSDPTTFGILMAYMTVFGFTLSFGPWKWGWRVLFAICTIIMLMGAYWSGTRTAFIVIPAGFFFVGLMAISKRQWVMVGTMTVLMLFGTAASQVSTSSNALYRVQTAFKPSKDRSYQVRLKTQARIKAIIQQHPFGGGLGSCGAWGKQFAPHTVFADIEPDSGYVRVAVETGWIGLIIYIGMLFTALRIGVRHFTRARDPVVVNLYMGLVGIVFALIVANYGQEAIILLPNSIVFYAVLAILVRLKDFDPDYVQTQEARIA